VLLELLLRLLTLKILKQKFKKKKRCNKEIGALGMTRRAL